MLNAHLKQQFVKLAAMPRIQLKYKISAQLLLKDSFERVHESLRAYNFWWENVRHDCHLNAF